MQPTRHSLSDDNTAIVSAIRDKMMAGLAPVTVFADAVSKSRRTVEIWIAQGMPIIHIGRTPYVDVDAARDWLRTRNARSIPTPVRRGRPANRKAA
jgi:hypothetical protein